jgi:pimeloyl-ACP methyl ester carboxylesterase
MSFRLGGRRGARAILIAVLFPIVVGLISYGIAWTVGLAHFSPQPDALAAWFVGDSTPPIVVFVINLALAAFVVAIFSARVAAGEEIGWRGYMLTRLIDAGVPRPGSRRAVFGQRSRCTRPGTASFRLRSTRRAQVPVRRCGSASRESSSCSPRLPRRWSSRAVGGRSADFPKSHEMIPPQRQRPGHRQQEEQNSMPYRVLVLILILLGAELASPLRSPAAGAQLGSAPELRWSACRDVPDTECAGLEVPVDPTRPDGTKFTLRLGRVAATDPGRKKGVLLFIPGGPGVGISGVFGQLRGLQHIDDFARQYDVVSFDPRGIGQSSPVRCDPDAVPPASEPIYHPPTSAEFEALVRVNAAFFQSCFTATGELMAHLSAIDTAADIERIRQALGPNDGLVAYAGSYGTVYGAAYLERYGDHIKSLVLDAVVDHSIDLATMVARNILSVADAFDRFARWCGHDITCALHGQDLGNVSMR